LFIDGAFLNRLARDFVQEFEPDSSVSIDYSRLSARYDRTIFYDALPVKKPAQSQESFAEKFEAKRRYLNDLRKIPNFHVRDGYTRNRPSADSRIEQKGVDTWIAVDVLLYALRGNIDVADVYTTDLDLYPMFEALLQTNTHGVLRYDPDRTSEELIQAADQSAPIRQTDLFNMLPPTFAGKYETKHANGVPNGDSKPVGQSEGIHGECRISFYPKDQIFYAEFDGIGNSFRCGNLKSIMRHINEWCGTTFTYDVSLVKALSSAS